MTTILLPSISSSSASLSAMNSTVDTVGWTAEPDGRGTMGLLWSCFATIFICTWSAFHPNVPADDDTPWTIFKRRCVHMVAGILAPEAVAYVACDQMFVVIQAKKRYKLICPHTRAPWTSKMYLFLLMGGFAVETHPGQRIRPTPHKMISLFEEGAIEFPDLEDSDIDTRTKADWFTKTIAIIQIGWFVAQLVGRAIQQLPTTTLELFTSSIVFCGTCTYAFWWKKPFDVQKPFVLYPAQQRQDSTRMWPKDAKRVSCWEAGLNEIEVVPAAFIGAIIVVGFAALHIVGWNFQFPSHVEKVLWRTMSLGCVVIPFIMLVGTRNLPWKYFLYPLAALYLLVRVYLFIEIFMGLRAVPAGVYKTPQWSQYFPALG